jgi:polygalacturonase
MAIVQISQITNRKGLAIDLPQLAGAELGWSTDTRQLFIGNGTLAEGAPVIGNTEILTEFSDIINVAASYTYKGTAAGYIVQTGPTSGTPVVQSLQSWLDQYASVKDFGAVGDGVTDDTDAINRALFQLYCREVNPQVRRSLFFPAGVYVVSDTINIPSYAMLIGEGANSSIIQLVNASGTVPYVAQTADSLQQTGVNIGSGSAIPPTEITVANMAFQSLDTVSDIFLLQSTSDSRFQNVSFIGPRDTSSVISLSTITRGVAMGSTSSIITNDVIFQGCYFTGTIYGIETLEQVQGITVDNSKFYINYTGISLGDGTVVNGGATGFRITNNMFDSIYAEGILLGDVSLNATGYNIFYDVGNYLQGITDPATPIINIQSNNNVSIGDMFARTDAYSTVYPRVDINQTLSIATTNGGQISAGTYTRKSGVVSTLANNQITAQPIFSVSPLEARAFSINYTTTRADGYRSGTFLVTSMSTSTTVQSMDDYVENTNIGIVLSVTQSAEGSPMVVNYTSTATGQSAQMAYSITYLA